MQGLSDEFFPCTGISTNKHGMGVRGVYLDLPFDFDDFPAFAYNAVDIIPCTR